LDGTARELVDDAMAKPRIAAFRIDGPDPTFERIRDRVAKARWADTSRPSPQALGGDVVLCTPDEDWAAQRCQLIAEPVGILSSDRQTEPSAFELPFLAPRLV
jgi:hypothetical protein